MGKKYKYVDFLDELFGPPGSKRRIEYEKFCKNKERLIAKAKKEGNWPKDGDIYFNELDEELHLVHDASGSIIWTEYGNKHIAMCGLSGPLSDHYKFIGRIDG